MFEKISRAVLVAGCVCILIPNFALACPHGFKLGPNKNGIECSEINKEINEVLHSARKKDMAKFELVFVDNDGDQVMTATVDRLDGSGWFPSGTYNICDVAEYGIQALTSSMESQTSTTGGVEGEFEGPILRKLASLEFIVQHAMESSINNKSCSSFQANSKLSLQSLIEDPLSSSTGGSSSAASAGPCAVAAAPACNGSCPAPQFCVPVDGGDPFCSCQHSAGHGTCAALDVSSCSGVCHTETVLTPQCHVTVNHNCKVSTPPDEVCVCQDIT